MNRIIHGTIRGVCAAVLGVALVSLSHVSIAQQTAPGLQIPADAKQAVLEFTDDGQITLNGKPARLSAATQIRGTTNLIVLSQSLRGKYLVRVVLDQGGAIHRAWIINGNH